MRRLAIATMTLVACAASAAGPAAARQRCEVPADATQIDGRGPHVIAWETSSMPRSEPVRWVDLWMACDERADRPVVLLDGHYDARTGASDVLAGAPNYAGRLATVIRKTGRVPRNISKPDGVQTYRVVQVHLSTGARRTVARFVGRREQWMGDAASTASGHAAWLVARPGGTDKRLWVRDSRGTRLVERWLIGGPDELHARGDRICWSIDRGDCVRLR